MLTMGSNRQPSSDRKPLIRRWWVLGVVLAVAFGAGLALGPVFYGGREPALDADRDALPVPWWGLVETVSDGDTLRIWRGGEQARCRLAGIDAPEREQPWGPEARDLLRSLVLGREVWVAADSRDHYGRLIVRLTLDDGRDVARVMVAEGAAWWYVEYARDDLTLARAEADARRGRRGLWAADPPPQAPWDYRAALRAAVREAAAAEAPAAPPGGIGAN